ncbi:MAG TPA: hypothetical protein VKB92_02560 [Myxococcales bacterium]|nr:hypothetical protein [Myxococcales bacterium]
MLASALTDALRDLWGPGLVFLALCAWLVRRALRAARNEAILEEQRLREFANGTLTSDAPSPSTSPSTSTLPSPSTLPSTSNSPSTSTPTSPLRVPLQLFRADVRGASQEHLDVLARLLAEREAAAGAKRVDVLWVRSNPTHVAWAEMRPGNREVICVAQIDSGTVVARWQFG